MKEAYQERLRELKVISGEPIDVQQALLRELKPVKTEVKIDNHKPIIMNDFILELIRRWGAKQPWFFKVVQWVGIAVALVLGLPEYLVDAGVIDQLPEAIQGLINKAVLWAGMIAALVAKLTATSEEKAERLIVD